MSEQVTIFLPTFLFVFISFQKLPALLTGSFHSLRGIGVISGGIVVRT